MYMSKPKDNNTLLMQVGAMGCTVRPDVLAGSRRRSSTESGGPVHSVLPMM